MTGAEGGREAWTGESDHKGASDAGEVRFPEPVTDPKTLSQSIPRFAHKPKNTAQKTLKAPA